MNELISIVVPIYNVEKELNRCFDSLINQTYHNIEIILVDDGSPDNCPHLCDIYAEKNFAVRAIHKENGGLSDARNAGLLEAKGKYVLFVDSDDYIEVDTCERFVDAIGDDDIDVIVGCYKEINGNEVKYFTHHNLEEKIVYNSKRYIISSISLNEWYAPAWLNLYNREFLLENKLFYKKGILYEDHQMLPRLFLCASRIKYLDYPFYNYVIRNNSIMTSKKSEIQRQMSLEIYEEWLDTFQSVQDMELQRYLYGALVKYYMANCRARKILGWKIRGMDFLFAYKYALNFKEKSKVLLFQLCPNIYCSI